MGPAPVLACSLQFSKLPAVYYNFDNHTSKPVYGTSEMLSNYSVTVEEGDGNRIL